MVDKKITEEEFRDAPPPILKSWSNLYAFVIGFLGFLVLIFALFTWYFS